MARYGFGFLNMPGDALDGRELVVDAPAESSGRSARPLTSVNDGVMSLRQAIANPSGKSRYVRRLFATIADRYDLITVLLSYGRDRSLEAAAHEDGGTTRAACGPSISPAARAISRWRWQTAAPWSSAWTSRRG